MCLFVCLFVCLFACIFVCSFVYLFAGMQRLHPISINACTFLAAKAKPMCPPVPASVFVWGRSFRSHFLCRVFGVEGVFSGIMCMMWLQVAEADLNAGRVLVVGKQRPVERRDAADEGAGNEPPSKHGLRGVHVPLAGRGRGGSLIPNLTPPLRTFHQCKAPGGKTSPTLPPGSHFGEIPIKTARNFGHILLIETAEGNKITRFGGSGTPHIDWATFSHRIVGMISRGGVRISS